MPIGGRDVTSDAEVHYTYHSAATYTDEQEDKMPTRQRPALIRPEHKTTANQKQHELSNNTEYRKRRRD